ncbi:major intrinsically disordered NOTCH2-binding receptor 1-like [Neosynchiropus ocellatus]
MDISALPNNNRPEKFLQLDVGMLPATHGMFQVGAAVSSHRHWHNRVYSQRDRSVRNQNSPPSSPGGAPVQFEDRYLEKHITPVTLKSNVKRNPLYMDIKGVDLGEQEKTKPSWTVKEYDTQTVHGNLEEYLKEDEKTAKDLDFWLEDLYTPGFDSLLRKTEAEQRRKKLCKLLTLACVSVCAVLVVIIVPVVVLQRTD